MVDESADSGVREAISALTGAPEIWAVGLLES
jgi:hypothetical protein